MYILGDCKPICPCLMDGINYDHGEQWKKKGYPCTTYECFNGFYKAIKEGPPLPMLNYLSMSIPTRLDGSSGILVY